MIRKEKEKPEHPRETLNRGSLRIPFCELIDLKSLRKFVVEFNAKTGIFEIIPKDEEMPNDL